VPEHPYAHVRRGPAPDLEQARGLREPGENANGFSATASRTVGVPVQRLYAAFMAGAGDMRLRTATEPRSARFDWQDGATRVNVGFTAVGPHKSRVALARERLADAADAAAMKAAWRERLGALKAELEQREQATATNTGVTGA
jgi:hypothetical protein